METKTVTATISIGEVLRNNLSPYHAPKEFSDYVIDKLITELWKDEQFIAKLKLQLEEKLRLRLVDVVASRLIDNFFKSNE